MRHIKAALLGTSVLGVIAGLFWAFASGPAWLQWTIFGAMLAVLAVGIGKSFLGEFDS